MLERTNYSTTRNAIATAISANNASITALQNANIEISNQIANLGEYPEAQNVLQNVINTNNSKILELSNSNSELNNTLGSLNTTEITVTTNNAEQINALQKTLSVVVGGIGTAKGASMQVDAGIAEVINGVNTLASSKDVLTGGAAQLVRWSRKIKRWFSYS